MSEVYKVFPTVNSVRLFAAVLSLLTTIFFAAAQTNEINADEKKLLEF